MDPGLYVLTGHQPLPYPAAPAQDIYGTTAGHPGYDHTQFYAPTIDPRVLSGVHDSTTSASMSDPVYEGKSEEEPLPDPVYEGKFEEEPLPDFESYKKADGLYYCREDGCEPGSYDSLRIFKKHMRTHLKPVICPLSLLCGGRRTAEQRDMIRHVRAYHSVWASRQQNLPQEDFVCDICRQTFTRRDNLRKHERDIHGIQA